MRFNSGNSTAFSVLFCRRIVAVNTHHHPFAGFSVFSSHSEKQRLDNAISTFHDLLTTRPLPPIVKFTKTVSSVVKMKHYDVALSMLDEMRQRGVAVDSYTLPVAVNTFHAMLRERPLPPVMEFTKVARFVVKTKHYSAALSLLDEMRQKGVTVNHYTMSIQINCYCLMNRVDLGFATLGNFFKYGYEPNVTTLTTLLRGLFLTNNVAEAEIFFKKLLRQKICEPNEVMISTVINGLCKTGHTLTALDLLDLLEKGSCRPNVWAYSTVIDSLCKDKMVDDALHLLLKMPEKGISPDIVTYSSVLQGLCNFSRFREVKDLLNEMDANKIRFDVVTFNILVDAFCKEGKIEEAEHVLQIMRQRNVCPNTITYNALIDGYCLRGEMEKAREIFYSMEDEGLKPDIMTYGSLINGFCKKGNVDEAWKLFLEIPYRGLEHTVVTYSSMIHGLFRVGRFSDGWKLFHEMGTRQVIPNLLTYGGIIDGLCRNQQVANAFVVLRMMEDNGVSPNTAIYNTLIQGLCKVGKLDTAKSLFYELPTKGLQPDVITYNIIIGALCQEGIAKEAKHLLLEMENNGCLPDSVTYNVIVQGLLTRNECGKAMEYLEEMVRRGFSADATTFSMLLEQQQSECLLDMIKKLIPRERMTYFYRNRSSISELDLLTLPQGLRPNHGTCWCMMLNVVYGRTFLVETNFFEKLKLQSWAIPKYSIQYSLKWQKQAISGLIEEAYCKLKQEAEECLKQERVIISNYLKFSSKDRILEAAEHEFLVHMHKPEEQ